MGVPEKCWAAPALAPTVATTVFSCEPLACTIAGLPNISNPRVKLHESKERESPARTEGCTCGDDDDDDQYTGMHHIQGSICEEDPDPPSGPQTREGMKGLLYAALQMIPSLSVSSFELGSAVLFGCSCLTVLMHANSTIADTAISEVAKRRSSVMITAELLCHLCTAELLTPCHVPPQPLRLYTAELLQCCFHCDSLL